MRQKKLYTGYVNPEDVEAGDVVASYTNEELIYGCHGAKPRGKYIISSVYGSSAVELRNISGCGGSITVHMDDFLCTDKQKRRYVYLDKLGSVVDIKDNIKTHDGEIHNDRNFKKGDIVVHYNSIENYNPDEPSKGYYYIVTFCNDIETLEPMVAIRELFGNCGTIVISEKRFNATTDGLVGPDSNIMYIFTRCMNMFDVMLEYDISLNESYLRNDIIKRTIIEKYLEGLR